MRQQIFIVLILLLLAGLVFAFAKNQVSESTYEEVAVSIGGVTVQADIADTPALRQQGLSGRQSLGENEGMLFIFDVSGLYGFWMNDMLFAIDIIWIDENERIVHLAENVSPESYPNIFNPATPARYVLEVKSGFVQEHAIKEGQEVSLTF